MKVCGECELFIPSPYNPLVGNGMCKVIVDGNAKRAERGVKPTSRETDLVYKEFGATFATASALCHPGQDRKNCTRFKPKLELVK